MSRYLLDTETITLVQFGHAAVKWQKRRALPGEERGAGMVADSNGGPQPEVEIWSGGLKWALENGYRKTEALQTVRQELLLWLENLDELIKALGPKATVGETLAQATDEDGEDDSFDDEDDEDD